MRTRSPVALCVAATIATFVACAATPASATLVTTAGEVCPLVQGENWYRCALTGGTAFSAGAAGAFFDFHLASAVNVDLVLYKRAYTGTQWFADNGFLNYSAGPHDVWVAMTPGLPNSYYDYYHAEFVASSTTPNLLVPTGVALESN
jgi:hypothetical protein